ncbi:MAG: transglutaminase-like domain-containing protein [Verrucomicrobia bacterium]|nr:transglutaminase-like domain-containing protein [Verrucomicrobiota bacterium]MDA1085888.1 transglutaminase-like domain-containing protein [Verrucomicrobiota bacterium]
MSGHEKISYLIRLLDDESELVRSTVRQELSAYGADLERVLREACPRPDKKQRQLFNVVIRDIKAERLQSHWPRLSAATDEPARLEAAFSFIAEFQLGRPSKDELAVRLDELSSEYRCGCSHVDVIELAAFLFRRKLLTGNRDDYYNPLNSNMLCVLEQGAGIPITLSAIYMLVGARLGLEIVGCNVPGHFMALVKHHGEHFLVDCFNGGRFMREEQIMVSVGNFSKIRLDLDDMKVGAEQMIERILRNLANAYERAGCQFEKQLMTDLLSGDGSGAEGPRS